MNLQICKKDFNTLETLLNNQNTSIPFKERKLLSKELSKMKILEDADLPEDVVKLNSKVTVMDEEKQITTVFKITLPSQANMQEKKVSVLAPISIALLGVGKDQIVEWNMPGGIKKLKVIEVIND
jgi:regulator of nucleoside diphosphate kinase